MDRWIGEWCSYNFAAGSFHTKKLYSRLFSREVEFYWHKQRYRVFVPPFGGLRGNVHGSSMARWKARGRLPIGDNWTVFASYHAWGAMSRYWKSFDILALYKSDYYYYYYYYWSKFRCLKGGGSLLAQISRGKGRPPPKIFCVRKIESLCYRMVRKLPKISTGWVGRTNVTDDRQTDGIAIAYSERNVVTFANYSTNFIK